MKKKYFKRAMITALSAVMAFLGTQNADAQNFTNTGSGVNNKYNATCGGVIKMKAASGTISGNNIGTNETNAIPGVVDWSATADGQTVQGTTFYSRLVVTGGDKTMADGIHVVGDACTTPLTGYANLATYPFYVSGTPGLNFGTGTFYYDGGTQNIYPTTDPYNLLNISSAGTVRNDETVSATTVTTTGTLNVPGTLNIGTGTSNLGGAVSLIGDGIINTSTGTGTTTFASTVDMVGTSSISVSDGDVTFTGAATVGSGTNITLNGDGNVTFNGNLALNGLLDADRPIGGLGDVTFAGTTSISGTGELDLGDNTNLFISGAISNTDAEGDNLKLNCNSNITYNANSGTQTIMPTANTTDNRYGNLILTGNAVKVGGTATYGNDVNICTDFSLAGGNLQMYSTNGTLRMNNPAGNAAYTNLAEVEGQMARVTDLTTRTYTFNNSGTTIDLAADNDNPTLVTMNVRQGQAPSNFDVAKDVNRKINLSYANNAGNFTMDAKVAYLYAEGPGTPDWTAPNTQASIRMYEATGGTPAPAGSREKIGTGSTPVRVPAVDGASFGTVALENIGNTATAALPNGIGSFASGNDVLLSAGPTTFYSIADGRWTNPATWDENALPSANDNVEVRTFVFAGIDAPFAGVSEGTGADNVKANNTQSEANEYGNNAVANIIEVANISGASLFIGNEDNGDSWVFKTAQLTGNTLINSNTNAMAPVFDPATGIAGKATFNAASSDNFNGIWITPWGGSTTRATNVQTNQIQNAGTFNNEGVVEIGQ